MSLILLQILATTRTAAVLYGPTGLGPWEEPEMRACLNQLEATGEATGERQREATGTPSFAFRRGNGDTQLCADSSELLSSAAVIAELQRGVGGKVQARLALLSNVELLEISKEVREIVRIYIQRLVMPNDPTGDALHLALASHYRVDVLLTWNCQHLANPNKMEHIRLVNYELGLPMPVLTTPLNYLSGGESDD